MSTRVLIAGEEEGSQYTGGVHNRPPVPDGTVKAECPKFMSHGPCGGVRKGGFCEVYPEMKCPWVALYFKLEESGQVEWMTQL
ncbi:MAG: methylenetetrahydrofolate reductase C-terminal domain-containing protein [Nitrospiraceae bacterium]